MKKILQFVLKILAKMVLKKYNPQVIGITGSVGKSSTKEAIGAVLRKRYRVGCNIKSYNNEIGVPLAILGMESGFKSVFAWLGIFAAGLKMILIRQKDYPEILVLEMGADKPGDLQYLTKLAPCQVSVVTAVAPVHLEFFKTMEGIAKEKQILVTHLSPKETAVLNYDDQLVYGMRKRTTAKIVFFGFHEEAMVRAIEPVISYQLADEAKQEQIGGTSFKLVSDGKVVPVFLTNVLGKQHIYAALAGAAAGILYGVNLVEIGEALEKDYHPPAGRMNLLRGIKNTFVIDDTYNASPQATIAALEVLRQITLPEKNKKIAVLGDMLELGAYAETGHQEVGRKAAEVGIDVLVAVGDLAAIIAQQAMGSGFPRDAVFQFQNTEEAGKFVQERIQQGDLILVKGSQKMRMERIVKEIMAEPLAACSLLCRQDKEWVCRQ